MFTRFTLLFGLWIGLIIPLLAAHNGSIQGQLFDAENRQPLLGANVMIKGTTNATTTNALGIFSFSNLEAGNYQLTVSYLGYEEKTVENIAVKDAESTVLKIDLVPSVILLPYVQIKPDFNENVKSFNALNLINRPLNSAQDVLRIVPGLVMAQHAGGGKAEQIFLRGFDIDHGTDIAIRVDGLPVNMVSHAHGQGYADLHFLIPETIENVDFRKGMYAAQSGNFTTAGQVDFQTTNALKESMIKLEAGQFNTFRTVAALDLLGASMKNRSQNAYVAAELLYSDGYFESPQNFSRYNIFGKYNGLIGNQQSITASFSHFQSTWNASGQIPQRAVDDGSINRFGAIDDTEGGSTSRTNFNVVFTKNLDGEATFKNQFFLSLYDFQLFSNFTFFATDPENGDQIRQTEDRQIIGYNGTYQKKGFLGNKLVKTELGLQIRYDQADDTELARTKDRTVLLEQLAFGDIDEWNLGIYWNGSIALSDNFTANAGLRYDQFLFNYEDQLIPAYTPQSQSKGVFSPKLNLNYRVAPNWTIYANAGIGFHSNDTRVVVAQSGEEILPRAFGIDLGTALKITPALWADFTVWQLDLEQEFVYVGDAGIVEPSGETRRRGLDIALRYQFQRWLSADIDFNFTDPIAKNEPEGENYIPLAPTTTSAGGFLFTPKGGFEASLRYRYVGDRAANEDNSVVADGYFLLDAILRYRQPKCSIQLAVENLLNSEWKEAQFDTESRLKNELEPVSEIHFTPGTPFFLRGSVTYFF